jgi:hypothetical protein
MFTARLACDSYYEEMSETDRIKIRQGSSDRDSNYLPC